MTTSPPLRRTLPAATALTAWFALVLQWYLIVAGTWAGIGPWLATLKYISYFTILSNLLVALACTSAVAGQGSAPGRFFSSARVGGGIALYIAVTGSIYFFVLRSLWAPQGAQWLADVMLHYATPLLYLALWLGWMPHGRLAWSDALRWLLFPLAYVAWALLRGAWLHDYPYPFLDVAAIGGARVFGNGLAMGGLFLVLGAILIAVDRALGRHGQPRAA